MNETAKTLNPSPQELYASRGRDYLVVWPAPAAMHGQASCYNKCLEEFRCARGGADDLLGPEAAYPASGMLRSGAVLVWIFKQDVEPIEICPSALHVCLQEQHGLVPCRGASLAMSRHLSTTSAIRSTDHACTALWLRLIQPQHCISSGVPGKLLACQLTRLRTIPLVGRLALYHYVGSQMNLACRSVACADHSGSLARRMQDVDEFMVPANHTDLPSFLATMHPNVSQACTPTPASQPQPLCAPISTAAGRSSTSSRCAKLLIYR